MSARFPLPYIGLLGVISAIAVGCASKPFQSKGTTYFPRMKSWVGETATTRYYSHANIDTFEDRQLVRQKHEIVDFSVVNTTTALHPEDDSYTMTVQTVRKDGTAPLHELAFPEWNEKIETRVNGRAEVLKAGEFSPDSLFFIPVLPLPKRSVEVGETWSFTHEWISESNGIPLVLDLVGILKGAKSCFNDDTCLDIEISGKVMVAAATSRSDAKFDGNVWGRILFSMKKGDVVWSETRGSEDIRIGQDGMIVLSCMLAQIQSEKTVIRKNDGFSCEPSREPVTRVPSF